MQRLLQPLEQGGVDGLKFLLGHVSWCLQSLGLPAPWRRSLACVAVKRGELRVPDWQRRRNPAAQSARLIGRQFTSS